MYDLVCAHCNRQLIDVFEPMHANPHRCTCGQFMERAWLTKFPSVIGDECDVTVKNGICWENGEPRRYTSKSEMKRVAKEKGLVNVVEHVGRQGGDTSPHTVRWV